MLTFGQAYPAAMCAASPVFSPPICCQLSLALGSSLLRSHLYPPALTPSLAPRLVRALPIVMGCYRTSPVKQSRLNLNPSVKTAQVIQLLGFPTFRKVTHLYSHPRFACATFQVPTTASFRPCCYQQRPCLDVAFPLVRRRGLLSGRWLALHAGRTKNRLSILKAGSSL